MKRKQEILAVVGLLLLIVLLVYFGLQTQQKYFGRDQPVVEEKAQDRVKLSEPEEIEKSAAAEQDSGSRKPVKSFFLTPSPSEIMALVKEIEATEIPVPRERYENLRIIWPTYFFKIIDRGPQTAKVLFDTSEDGFGVNIVSEINHLKYPEILTASPYQKIWLAGQIEGIDPEGTGTIYMQTEYVRFREQLEELKLAGENEQEKE